MSRPWRSAAWWLLLAGLVTWIGAVFVSPWAQSRGSLLGPLIWLFFDPLCHQLPERSFSLLGHALPVCHRCLGLYLGFAAGWLLLPWLPALGRRLLAEPRWLIAAVVPLLVDVFLLPNTPWSRFGTGAVAAFPVALFVWLGVSEAWNGLFTRVATPGTGAQSCRTS